MLAGCSSSTLLSPRNHLRSEVVQSPFQACLLQFPPSMSAQRLDLPCSFSHSKDASSVVRSPSIRPVALSVEKQSIRLPPLSAANQQIKQEFWNGKGKNLKRIAEQVGIDDDDESSISNAKRKRACRDDIGDGLILSQFGGGVRSFWYHQQPDGDEGLCFLPGSSTSPFMSEIADLGEGNDGESSQVKAQDSSDSVSGSDSGSSSSSGSERFAAAEAGPEIGNGSSRNPSYHHHQGSGSENERGEEESFELLSVLMACVEAIRSKNITLINHLIEKLGSQASPRGSSPITRLIAYYTEALAVRVSRVWPQVFHVRPPREYNRIDDDTGIALRLLNEVSPIPKFIYFTANEMLLRAFEGKDKVHIIDFDIKEGLQWPSLFQSLASRVNPPSHVRITGIGESKQELNETGDRLAGFAEALRLPFEFHAVVDRLEDVRLWMLHVKENESVGVNCILQLHKTLYDNNINGGGGALKDFLGLIRSTNPRIVVMAEQEAEHNDPRLETRVAATIKYYGAIFDSLDTSLPPNSSGRLKIEEMFGREIRNMIGCEGRERYERHVGFEKWKKVMEKQGGLRCVGIRDDRELLQSQILLKMYSSADGFNVRKIGEGGAQAVCLAWEEQPLYSVSGWTAAEIS
ncbi:scarecrow-like protein 28 [Cucurbita maxima]|uniref:Scarecrow-like protein 28 n=1 Tax=Cucurbita maxima TaxID=3661 RepID=A0A6J1L1J0_CUCMA|nr:scarecrow-like protein 28 [Cucurbita maxima]